MKKLLLLLLFFTASDMFPQASESLQLQTKKLYDAFNTVDIDLLTEMLCTNTDKQATYDKLDAAFLNEELKMRFVFTNAKFNYSSIKSIGSNSYSSINFRNVIRITYYNPIDVEAIQKSLKEKYNAMSVAYEKARNSFLIIYNAKLIASTDNGTVWRFTFDDNTLPAVISEGCVNENIKKEFALNK